MLVNHAHFFSVTRYSSHTQPHVSHRNYPVC